MIIIGGDATVIAKHSGGILCHQVNCQKIANAGIAKQIRSKWPSWWEAYKVRSALLGNASLHKVQSEPEPLWIADLYGQYTIGTSQRQTDYKALENAFKRMLFLRATTCPEAKIFIPYGIGCKLGGGDWNIVYAQILIPLVPDAVIVKLPN